MPKKHMKKHTKVKRHAKHKGNLTIFRFPQPVPDRCIVKLKQGSIFRINAAATVQTYSVIANDIRSSTQTNNAGGFVAQILPFGCYYFLGSRNPAGSTDDFSNTGMYSSYRIISNTCVASFTPNSVNLANQSSTNMRLTMYPSRTPNAYALSTYAISASELRGAKWVDIAGTQTTRPSRIKMTNHSADQLGVARNMIEQDGYAGSIIAGTYAAPGALWYNHILVGALRSDAGAFVLSGLLEVQQFYTVEFFNYNNATTVTPT